ATLDAAEVPLEQRYSEPDHAICLWRRERSVAVEEPSRSAGHLRAGQVAYRPAHHVVRRPCRLGAQPLPGTARDPVALRPDAEHRLSEAGQPALDGRDA